MCPKCTATLQRETSVCYLCNGSFIPPYSPDLDPVEELFSKVKACLKENDEAIQAAAFQKSGLDGNDVSTLSSMSSITRSATVNRYRGAHRCTKGLVDRSPPDMLGTWHSGRT